MKRAGALIGLAMTFSLMGEARADEEGAQRAFAEGAAAFEKKDYVDAARSFERAFAMLPRGAAMLNAGLSWEAAGDWPRAADAFALALARADLRPGEAAQAQKGLDALRPRLCLVEIRSPVGAKVKLAHVEGRAVPVRVYVSPGTHVIEVTTATGKVTSAVEAKAGAEEALDVEAPPVPVKEPREDRRPAPAPVTDDGSSTRTWGFVLAGGAVVFAGAATVLGLSALSARDEFVDSGETSVDAHDRAATLRLLTNVAWGATAASGLGAAYLLYTGYQQKARARAMIGPTFIGLRGTF